MVSPEASSILCFPAICCCRLLISKSNLHFPAKPINSCPYPQNVLSLSWNTLFPHTQLPSLGNFKEIAKESLDMEGLLDVLFPPHPLSFQVGYMKVSKVFCRAKNSNLGYQLKGTSCYITEVSMSELKPWKQSKHVWCERPCTSLYIAGRDGQIPPFHNITGDDYTFCWAYLSTSKLIFNPVIASRASCNRSSFLICHHIWHLCH